MKIEPKIAAAAAELTGIRRDIHAHPELGFEEERTSNRRRKKASVLAQVALSTSRSMRSGCSMASTWPMAPPVE